MSRTYIFFNNTDSNDNSRMERTKSIRLNKFISDSGFCSRREADKFIEQGKVFVNKQRAQIGDFIEPKDKVYVNGHFIAHTEPQNLIIALNKPIGITSTTEKNTDGNIIDFVHHSQRVFPIGRLDKDSQGLIMLTNNGDLVNKILRAGNKHEKEYVVTVDKPITPEFIEGMANGVPLLGTMTKKCKVEKETPFIFRITLIQGLNRQIRRMCSHFGYEVVKLERVRIMNITLKGLPLGDWRDLDEKEVAELMSMLEGSSSTPRKDRSFSKNKQARKTKQTDHREQNDRPRSKFGKSGKPKFDNSKKASKLPAGKSKKVDASKSEDISGSKGPGQKKGNVSEKPTKFGKNKGANIGKSTSYKSTLKKTTKPTGKPTGKTTSKPSSKPNPKIQRKR